MPDLYLTDRELAWLLEAVKAPWWEDPQGTAFSASDRKHLARKIKLALQISRNKQHE